MNNFLNLGLACLINNSKLKLKLDLFINKQAQTSFLSSQARAVYYRLSSFIALSSKHFENCPY